MGVNTILMAKYFGVSDKFVTVGNGAAELIKSLMGLLSGKMGVILPTFEEYPNRMDKMSIVSYTPENRDFSYSVNDLKLFFDDKDISTLLVINPDNPSGNYIKKADLLLLIDWAEKKKIRLIIDESFADFSDETMKNTLLSDDIMSDNPHLILIKSISKSYGVPGLRLGVLASGDTQLIQEIRKDLPIWNINSFAEFYMQIFNKYEVDYQQACKSFIAEREHFYDDLSKISYLRVIPSQANYFLCEITNRYSSKVLTEKLLVEHNILIKDCSTKKSFQSGNYVRIAIRSRLDNMKLVSVLNQI